MKDYEKGKVLEKVRKLLMLGEKNPSENEAILAVTKAQELLAKYNLSMESVTIEEEEVSSQEYDTGDTKNRWKYALANIVATNFRCKVCVVGNSLKFYGYALDTEMAIKSYEYLYKVCTKTAGKLEREARKIYGTAKGVNKGYCYGFVLGVKKALDAQSVALMIIVPSKVEKEYEKATSVGFRKVTRRVSGNTLDRDSYNQGIRDGKSVASRKTLGAQ